MKKLFLFILPVPLLFAVWLLRCVVGYSANEISSVTSSRTVTLNMNSSSGVKYGTVTYHTYGVNPTDIEENVSTPQMYSYYVLSFDIPITIEFNLGLTSGEYYSGHINIPVYNSDTINTQLAQAIFSGYVAGGSNATWGCTLTVRDMGSDNLRASQFIDSNGNLYVTVYFENYQYNGGIEVICDYHSTHGIYLSDITTLNDSNYRPNYSLYFSNNGLPCAGFYEAGSSLSTVIANGINASSDIDTLLLRLQSAVSYLSSIGEDISSIFSQVNNINGILSNVYSELQYQSTLYNSRSSELADSVSRLRQLLIDMFQAPDLQDSTVYELIDHISNNTNTLPQILAYLSALSDVLGTYDDENILEVVQDMNSVLYSIKNGIGYSGNVAGSDTLTLRQQITTLISQLSFIHGSIPDLYDVFYDEDGNNYLRLMADYLYQIDEQLDVLNNIYTSLNGIYRYDRRILAALSGSEFSDSATVSTVASATRQNWINIITEALNNIELKIEVEQDIYQTIEISSTDVKDYLSDSDKMNDFNLLIFDNWSSYIQNIDFNIFEAGHLPPAIAPAVATGRSLLEQFYSTIGDFSFLILSTLVVGLIAALIGPINRFVSSRAGSGKK